MPRPPSIPLPFHPLPTTSSRYLAHRRLLQAPLRPCLAASSAPLSSTCSSPKAPRSFSSATPASKSQPFARANTNRLGQAPENRYSNTMTVANRATSFDEYLTTHRNGHDGTHSPHPQSMDFDTSFDEAARRALGIKGLVPPAIENYSKQEKRCLEQINLKGTSIDRYSYLSNLRNTNCNLFYRLLIDNMRELTPYVYTPVVGEACLKWSHIYEHPEGLYLSYSDRGNLHEVIANWPQENVEITVITDGSRILGLGDLGVNGMGIPVGKLALYTACAGIHPERTLPITIDFGTDNEEFLNDDLYMGARHKRVSENEQREFMDEMMVALNDRWRNIVVQFEDFKSPFWSLDRYRNTYTVFNDDIQGTGAVILGGVISAFKRAHLPINEQKLVFMGAGSAAVGVAKQICGLFIRNGIPEAEAKKMIWLVDSRGLVTNDRGDKLAEHKLYFSRDDNEGQQFKSLEQVVDYVKPTALVGLCTIGGVFTEPIVRKMAELNENPIIFPLSNPSSKSECTFEQAMEWTNNKVVFASGSPFPSVTVDGVEKIPGQGNNMYVFPGIGLGTILCGASHVTDEMIYASAAGLAESLTPEEIEKEWLYPELSRIREVSVVIARDVIRAAQKEGIDRNKLLQFLSDEGLEEYIREKMYDPKVPRIGSRSASEEGSPRGRSHL